MIQTVRFAAATVLSLSMFYLGVRYGVRKEGARDEAKKQHTYTFMVDDLNGNRAFMRPDGTCEGSLVISVMGRMGNPYFFGCFQGKMEAIGTPESTCPMNGSDEGCTAIKMNTWLDPIYPEKKK